MNRYVIVSFMGGMRVRSRARERWIERFGDAELFDRYAAIRADHVGASPALAALGFTTRDRVVAPT